MKKLIVILTFLIAFVEIGLSQKQLPVHTTPMPTIGVSDLRKNEKPVRISEVKVNVKVVGTMAVTTVDMIFHNPNNRVLEGELQFPLGDGQSISRFALDINGKLREGVVVDKAKGQEAFESVIRQNIDPGLLEKTQGNNFRARVYPLPAKGTRHIVIAYEQELVKDGKEYRFHLPVQYGDRLDKFDLNLTVFSSPKKPEVNETPWGTFSFDKAGDAYIASYSTVDFEAKGQLVFSVPDNNSSTIFVEQGKMTGNTYFYGIIHPELKKEVKNVAKPSRISIYWDASSSMAERDLDKELDFLDLYFTSVNNCTVHLHTFNIKLNKPSTFIVKNGDWSTLKNALKSINYDGGTQLGILNLGTLPIYEQLISNRVNSAVLPTDQVFLFSDGLSNFGKQEPMMGTVLVITVTSLLSSNYTLLNHIASATSGKYINLQQQSPAEAMDVMNENELRFLYADYNKNEVSDLTPSASQAINSSSVFSVTGRLKTASATVVLHFGVNGKILYSQTIQLKKSDTADYDNIVERVWAEKKIAELEVYYEKNKLEIESIGKRYNIVTRNTSLIVLDRVEDYVRYEITPPAELLDEYNRIVNFANKDRQENEVATAKRHLENVIRMFDARKVWWNNTFPKTCLIKAKLPSADNMSSRQSNPTLETHTSATSAQRRDRFAENNVAELREVVVHDDISFKDSEPANKNTSGNKIPTQPIQYTAKIELKSWNPDTPYMTVLKDTPKKELYKTYLSIKEKYKSTPSFYLDVASLFEKEGLKEEALVILSNLSEMEVENYRLLRVLANRLNQLGYTEYTTDFFNKVLELRPNEPQSYRDLASAYSNKGDYQKAIDNLYEIVRNKWDRRFPEIQVIALEEMNRIIALTKRKGISLDLSKIDDRFIYEMPVDIRIVLNWDTDNSDMDLWVTDPCGEICMYNNARTRIGGLISRDFTGGYGPEEFLIREAIPGKYTIQANYYGSREQTIVGPTTIYLDIYTYYSSGKEKKETITLRLTDNKQTIDIGEIIFEKR